MAMKTMNLAKLPVWIIVMIHIFHFGAGETFKWIKSGCSNYTFHGNFPPLFWEQSRQLCKKTGLGDLVSIESKAEWTLLKNTILNLTVADEYFIGLRKDFRSGQWGWLSNKNTSQTDLPWALREPNGDGNCALMYKDYRGDYGKYNDLGCLTHAGPGYICEFPVDRCEQEGSEPEPLCLKHLPRLEATDLGKSFPLEQEHFSYYSLFLNERVCLTYSVLYEKKQGSNPSNFARPMFLQSSVCVLPTNISGCYF